MTSKVMKRTSLSILAAASLVGCGTKDPISYTLYRNSPLELTDRVLFATFDAPESAAFNRGNCTMAARLLNANVIAANKADGKPPVGGAGFWCEAGPYKKSGNVPTTFETAFPADTDNPLSW